MNFFILANGPYNSVFIGPFDSLDDAESYAEEVREAHPDFGFLAVTEEERDANMADFGPLESFSPDDWKRRNAPREEDPYSVQHAMVRDPKTGFFEW